MLQMTWTLHRISSRTSLPQSGSWTVTHPFGVYPHGMTTARRDMCQAVVSAHTECHMLLYGCLLCWFDGCPVLCCTNNRDPVQVRFLPRARVDAQSEVVERTGAHLAQRVNGGHVWGDSGGPTWGYTGSPDGLVLGSTGGPMCRMWGGTEAVVWVENCGSYPERNTLCFFHHHSAVTMVSGWFKWFIFCIHSYWDDWLRDPAQRKDR